MTDGGSSQPAGRALPKAYRPLPGDVRAAAVARGLAAWECGDFYLAHEELEPAWMGTPELAERALLAGLIKLAAGFVHAARGNPLGMQTNLRGARERLATAGPESAAALGLDLAALLALVDDRLAAVEPLVAGELPVAETPVTPAGHLGMPVPSHDVAGPPAARWRSPLPIPAFQLPGRSP